MTLNFALWYHLYSGVTGPRVAQARSEPTVRQDFRISLALCCDGKPNNDVDRIFEIRFSKWLTRFSRNFSNSNETVHFPRGILGIFPLGGLL